MILRSHLHRAVLVLVALACASGALADPSPPPPQELLVTAIDALHDDGRVHVHVELFADATGTPGILFRGLSPDIAQAVAVPGSPTTAVATGLDLWDRAPLADDAGVWYWAQMVSRSGEVVLAGPVAPHAPPPLPGVTALAPPAPNPTRGAATLRFAVGADVARGMRVPVRLTVFDLRGRTVRTLVAEARTAAAYAAQWDGRDACGRAAPAGVYVVQLSAGARALTRKLVITR